MGKIAALDNRPERKDRMVALGIVLATFVVFWWSPVHHLADSRYQMMFSQQLLWHHSFSIDSKLLPDMRPHAKGETLKRGVDFSFHLEQIGDRFYCWFPPGSTILSIPYVALANVAGIRAIDRSGVYDQEADQRIQATLAPLVMAGLCGIIFLTSRILLSFRWSLIVTLAAAFGTPIWSIASRTMWIHTWGIFILGVVIWLIVRLDTGRGRPHPILLGTGLSWLYFVRPTFSIAIVAVAVYLLICKRPIFLSVVLTGVCWLALFLSYSWYHFGRFLPDYYQSQRFGFAFGRNFWEGFAGTLVSPARGLLIYLPILLLVLFWIIRYRKYAPSRLTVLAVSVICVHVIVISGYRQWDGGWCYGPRYCTDIVPWLALLAMLAVSARERYRLSQPSSRGLIGGPVGAVSAALLLLATIALHAIGATSRSAWRWNALAKNPVQFRAQMWDWKHPPFLSNAK